MLRTSANALPQSRPAAPAEPPRYRQILNILRRRIGSGRYKVGTHLPTESELCTEFEASRHTVREALRGLVELGLVKRRQGSGSLVEAVEPNRVYSQSFKSLADLFQFALDTYYVVLSMKMVRPSAEILRAIGGEPDSSWLLITGLRRDRPGGTPICYTDSYVPQRLAWLKPEFPGCVGPFYAHIEARSGEPIIEATQEISGVRMTREIATALDRKPGSIALRVLRRYVSARGTLIASFNWHPADSFVYRMQLQRSAPVDAKPRRKAQREGARGAIIRRSVAQRRVGQ